MGIRVFVGVWQAEKSKEIPIITVDYLEIYKQFRCKILCCGETGWVHELGLSEHLNELIYKRK